jgi:hypothetical protein
VAWIGLIERAYLSFFYNLSYIFYNLSYTWTHLFNEKPLKVEDTVKDNNRVKYWSYQLISFKRYLSHKHVL